MTAEPIDAPEDSGGDTAASSAASRAEAPWQWLNEQDAAAARRRAPVSARARVWASTLGGPALAAVLAQVDVVSLSDDECVVYAQAVTRQQSWTDAMLFDVTARFAAHRPGPDPDESFGFPPEPGVERRIQLDRIIDRVVARHDPDAARAKAEQARQGRQVWIGHSCDDHADIAGTLDGAGAEVLDRRLDQLAKTLGRITRVHGEDAGYGPVGETYDQRRARALVLLATPTAVARLLRLDRASDDAGAATAAGTAGGGDAATADASADAVGLLSPITLHVHLRADHTLDLEGLGVLSLPTVRDLLGSGAGSVKVTPVIDLNATYTSSGYQPSERLREQTVLINDTCRFPYCQRPARDSDYEHTVRQSPETVET